MKIRSVVVRVVFVLRDMCLFKVDAALCDFASQILEPQTWSTLHTEWSELKVPALGRECKLEVQQQRSK